MRLGFKTKSILQEVKYLPSIVKLMWNFDRKHLILSGILKFDFRRNSVNFITVISAND